MLTLEGAPIVVDDAALPWEGAVAIWGNLSRGLDGEEVVMKHRREGTAGSDRRKFRTNF
jgi:hypothetical protein